MQSADADQLDVGQNASDDLSSAAQVNVASVVSSIFSHLSATKWHLDH